jgi:hypothetical protein
MAAVTMRSPRKNRIERIERLTLADEGGGKARYVELGARVRVFRRGPDGKAQPAERLPWLFGGRYDRLEGRYVAPPENPIELTIHPGQIPLVRLMGEPGVRRVLGLGAPGGGKTRGIVTVAVLFSLWRHHGLGGVVSPVRDKLDIVWKRYLEIMEPAGWVRRTILRDREIWLENETIVQFRAAKKQSASDTSPIAGHDWHWAVEDEQEGMDDAAEREVDARGRINPDYQVFSSATNENDHTFQTRVVRYEQASWARVVRFAGTENCFTSLTHWDALRAQWGEEDYEQIINCRTPIADGRIYNAYDLRANMAPLPAVGRDLTRDLLQAQYNHPASWIVGWDPGVIFSASVILKPYAEGHERIWFAVDEVTTRDVSTEWHAEALRKWFADRNIPQTEVVVLGDPHEERDTDRSDYTQMRRAGFTCFRSNGGAQIPRRHRYAMTNALLKDHRGHRRLFLVPDSYGKPKAAKLAESLDQMKYAANGDPEFFRKTYKNLAHWTDALGFGLFPFERIRGIPPTATPLKSMAKVWGSKS